MATSQKKYGFNREPRLSANQLSEYLNVGAPRRKAIRQAAKYPSKKIVAQYDGAWQAISKYLCDQSRSAAHLMDAIDRLKEREKRPGATPWIQRDSRLSIDAIESFRKAYNKLIFPKLTCKAAAVRQPKVSIEGVDVSVAIDVSTHRVNPKTDEPLVGGVVFLFSKSETSARARQERCRTTAVLIKLFADENLAKHGQVDPKICLSLDVFGGIAHPTPGSYITRLDHIKASCEDIAHWWPRTEPPEDYDGP